MLHTCRVPGQHRKLRFDPLSPLGDCVCRGSSDESEGEAQGSELASPDATSNANGGGTGSTKIWVEQIYGWRYPLCEGEKEAER